MTENGDGTILTLPLWATAWNGAQRCVVCGGFPGKRKPDAKCNGGMNANGEVAYCTVREAQGQPLAHRVGGGCGCGAFHPKPPGSNGSGHVPAGDDLNGYHHGPDGMPAFTDTRNAQRFADRFGEHVRKDHTRGKKATEGWRLWDGVHWARDQTEVVMLRAKEIVAELAAEIDSYNESAGMPANVLAMVRGYALACESTGRLGALLQNAGSLLPATHETWDPDPYLLNCKNGTVDLHTGELLEHRPDRWQAKLAPVDYDPECKTPVWDAFLERVFAGDADLISFVQRAVGVSLVGKVIEHVLFVMYGNGANGKSTFVNVWVSLLGDYSREAAIDLLVEHANPQHPTSIAELDGVRFVAVGELRGQKFDEGLVKALTGGDARNARFMFQDSFVYVPTDTFWMATNHKPNIVGNSPGIWRRVRLLPFEVQIPSEEQDRDLGAKLRAEYPGILAWAVQGCLDWQAHGLGHAAAVDAATAEYRTEMDTLAAFLGDQCVIGPELSVPAADLYKAYETWSEEGGEKPTTQKWFGLRLGERGFTRRRFGKERHWTWIGLRLRGDGDLFDGPDPGSPVLSAEHDLETALPFRDSTESTATEPPERTKPDAEDRVLADPLQTNECMPEIKNDVRRTHERVIPFKAHAGADEDSKSGLVHARAREQPALKGDYGYTGPPEIESAPRPVLASNGATAPNAAPCAAWPVRSYSPKETVCPLCRGAMYHRLHGAHWDHECRVCPVKFRDPDLNQPPTTEARP
jgi:P4 family phage/plasmid primase-like protien